MGDQQHIPDGKAKTEQLSPGIEQIPFEALEACGEIFAEGEIKYGRYNWKKGIGDKEYQRERTRHAIRHLILWANGDRSEPHLAKVMWFCVTQIWTDKREQPDTNSAEHPQRCRAPATSQDITQPREIGAIGE